MLQGPLDIANALLQRVYADEGHGGMVVFVYVGTRHDYHLVESQLLDDLLRVILVVPDAADLVDEESVESLSD